MRKTGIKTQKIRAKKWFFFGGKTNALPEPVWET
jgi:hypothetical protein